MRDAFTRAGYSVRGLANWILDYADELSVPHTNMGINKLVFFAVEFFLRTQGILLTNAKIEAWEHGPVFRELYQSFKSYGNSKILGRARSFSAATESFEETSIELDQRHAELLKAALKSLMTKTASELRALSHEQNSAWHSIWWYDGRANPGMEITPQTILESKKGYWF